MGIETLQAGGWGMLVFTCGVNNLVAENEAFAKFVLTSIRRHLRRDWGDVCPEDKAANDQSLKDGSRLLSAYTSAAGVKVWIITEAADDEGKRPATTVLLPEEY